MHINEYQRKAHTFASYGENVMYPALGLAEEAGEAAGKIAKFIRKHNGRAPRCGKLPPKAPSSGMYGDEMKFRFDLMCELGDVCWMVAELATMFDLSLSTILNFNIGKLNERKKLNLIDGSGDTIAERIANNKKGK